MANLHISIKSRLRAMLRTRPVYICSTIPKSARRVVARCDFETPACKHPFNCSSAVRPNFRVPTTILNLFVWSLVPAATPPRCVTTCHRTFPPNMPVLICWKHEHHNSYLLELRALGSSTATAMSRLSAIEITPPGSQPHEPNIVMYMRKMGSTGIEYMIWSASICDGGCKCSFTPAGICMYVFVRFHFNAIKRTLMAAAFACEFPILLYLYTSTDMPAALCYIMFTGFNGYVPHFTCIMYPILCILFAPCIHVCATPFCAIFPVFPFRWDPSRSGSGSVSPYASLDRAVLFLNIASNRGNAGAGPPKICDPTFSTALCYCCLQFIPLYLLQISAK